MSAVTPPRYSRLIRVSEDPPQDLGQPWQAAPPEGVVLGDHRRWIRKGFEYYFGVPPLANFNHLDVPYAQEVLYLRRS